MGEIKGYHMSVDKNKPVSKHFMVSEFASKDGAELVLIGSELVEVLERIREHFGKPVYINSGYRSPTHNANVGGVPNSTHVQGIAADIVVQGVSPVGVAQYAEYILSDHGGIGLYNDSKSGFFVHVDTREARSRWHQVNGKETVSHGFPGYKEEKQMDKDWFEDFQKWVKENGISDGTRPNDNCTRAEAWTMLHQLYNLLKGGK